VCLLVRYYPGWFVKTLPPVVAIKQPTSLLTGILIIQPINGV